MADPVDPTWLTPRAPRPLTGDEPVGDGQRISDFWRWAFSDLRDNVTRGVLAEWLVGVALGCVDGVRPAWGDVDLRCDGITIEVKSAAHLQSWPTARHSRISFGRLHGAAWDEAAGRRSAESTYRADVYVFAIQTARDHAHFDPIDLDQWEFWVAPRGVIEATGGRSLSLSRVQALAASPLRHDGLATAVHRAAGHEAP